MCWLAYMASNIAMASALAAAAYFAQHRLGQPAVARWLWLLALVKLVTPPVISLSLNEASGSLACTLGFCACSGHSSFANAVRMTLFVALPILWAVGAAATAGTAWHRWMRFNNLLAHAGPVPGTWQRATRRLAAEIGLRRAPQVLAVPWHLPPMVIPGVHGARLLVPAELLPTIDRVQRETLLLHELVHIRRGDHLVRMLELVAQTVYWWLPVVATIGGQLRSCEEACCDAAVLARRPYARRDYARLLIDVLDFSSSGVPHRVQATAMSVASDLEQRLRDILKANQSARRKGPTAALALGIAVMSLPCGLEYGFAGHPPAAITSPVRLEGCESAPSASRTLELASMCCPG